MEGHLRCGNGGSAVAAAPLSLRRLRYQHIALQHLTTLLLHQLPTARPTPSLLAYLLRFIQICWKLQDHASLKSLLQMLDVLQLDFSEDPSLEQVLEALRDRFAPSFYCPTSSSLPSALSPAAIAAAFPPSTAQPSLLTPCPVEVVHVSSQSCWAFVLEKLIDSVRANSLHTCFQFVFPDDLRGNLSGVSFGSQLSMDSESPVLIPLQNGEESVKTPKPLEAWAPSQQLLQSLSQSSSQPLSQQPPFEKMGTVMETNVESSLHSSVTSRGFFLSYLHFLFEGGTPHQPAIVSRNPFVPQAAEEDGPLTLMSQETPSMTMTAADRQRNQKWECRPAFPVAVSCICENSSAIRRS